MVKRIVDTEFWTDMQVIDHYSIEDKYFSLYLMTNDQTTQLGIYPLPKKIMSFQTGFTEEVIQVLLERFTQTYGRIMYSEDTQEMAVLGSLSYTILKGGKPVSDLLEKELTKVNDSKLILATYEEMKGFWKFSKRPFDQTIQTLFESELKNRGLFLPQNDNENATQNDNVNVSQNGNDNQNDNENDNEESQATNRTTNRETIDEIVMMERYANYLKETKPHLEEKIHSNNIHLVYFREMIGELTPPVERQLQEWAESLPKSLIVEALHRSVKANTPLSYAGTIIDNWRLAGVKTYRDVMRLDKEYSGVKS